MRLEGVGRRYGLRGPWVLRGVDLEVPPGALLRVEGGNGSGKSTLLRLLARIDAPSVGRITGRPRTAYVPERFPAELPFTALGYLTHLGRVHGLRGPVATGRAAEWLERFGAAGHARTPLPELSKGTSQKVAVAQALLAEPDLLVLDEAWTGLDQAARAVLDEAVTARVAHGGAVVFVDHDPRRLAGARHTVHRVREGRLVAVPAGAGGSDPAAPGARVAGVLIEAEGAPGARLPRELPGDPVRHPGRPDPRDPARDSPAPVETVRLTVAAADSDAALRALLTARPPWHITAVTPVPGPAGTGPASGPAAPSTSTTHRAGEA